MPCELDHGAGIHDWLASISPPDTPLPLSPPLVEPLEYPSSHHNKRKRHSSPPRRKRLRLTSSLLFNNSIVGLSMASATSAPSASSTSAATSVSGRTILKPVPPSRKSQSPTRKHHRLLAHAVQPINIRQPRDAEQHESVAAVRAVLSKRHGFQFIHTGLKDRLRAANRDAFDNDVHEYMFYDDPATPPSTLDYTWRKVENIYKIAQACNDRKKDENAWSKVLDKVVNTALKLSNIHKLELNSVQTQNIEPRYLASTGSNTSKKADFVLTFTDQETAVKSAYQAFTSKHGHKSLSPMTDAYTSELAFACAFELKESNGGHSEAEIQLATLHTAMLLKLEDLAQDTGATVKMPALVGWVVVGHNWFCYISTQCPDGSIEVQGPFNNLQGSTQTHHEILKLLSLFKQLCSNLLCQRLWPTVQTVLTADSSSAQNTATELPKD